MKQTPILQAMVLADLVNVDNASGKATIIGVFGKVLSTKFPNEHGGAWVFLILTEVLGKTDIQLRLVHLNDNRVLMNSESIEIDSSDPLIAVNLALPIPPFPLPEPGIYAFECYAGDELIGAVRLQVMSQGDTGEES